EVAAVRAQTSSFGWRQATRSSLNPVGTTRSKSTRWLSRSARATFSLNAGEAESSSGSAVAEGRTSSVFASVSGDSKYSGGKRYVSPSLTNSGGYAAGGRGGADAPP